MNNNMSRLNGTVIQGFRIASGLADSSPFPEGTLKMQEPVFKKRGLDLGKYFSATLNVDIKPGRFEVVQPDWVFEDIAWAEGFPSETFSFIHCSVGYKNGWYEGLIYYPHPATKIGHLKPPSVLEIIAPRIEGVAYGDSVIITVRKEAVKFIDTAESPGGSRG